MSSLPFPGKEKAESTFLNTCNEGRRGEKRVGPSDRSRMFLRDRSEEELEGEESVTAKLVSATPNIIDPLSLSIEKKTNHVQSQEKKIPIFMISTLRTAREERCE